MYTIQVKKWHMDVPNFHETGQWFRRVSHNERFWPIVITIAVIAVLIMLSIVASLTAGSPTIEPVDPVYYGF